MYSVKNLRDVIILTIFMLAVFALLGLQVYMGVLSQVEDNPRFFYEREKCLAFELFPFPLACVTFRSLCTDLHQGFPGGLQWQHGPH